MQQHSRPAGVKLAGKLSQPLGSAVPQAVGSIWPPLLQESQVDTMASSSPSRPSHEKSSEAARIRQTSSTLTRGVSAGLGATQQIASRASLRFIQKVHSAALQTIAEAPPWRARLWLKRDPALQLACSQKPCYGLQCWGRPMAVVADMYSSDPIGQRVGRC